MTRVDRLLALTSRPERICGLMMDADAYFADDYRSARGKFLAACRAARLLPQSYAASAGDAEHRLPLAETVRLGDPAARHMMVVCGGDRKADALCCSAIEVGWLTEFATAVLPRDSAVLFVHHGPAPATGGELPSQAGPPPEWEDDLLAKVEKRYAEYAREKGVDALGAPLPHTDRQKTAGYPAALLDSMVRWLDSAADGRIVFVDVRVGLGPFGEAEIVPCHAADSEAARRVRNWFELADSPTGDHAIAPQQPDSLTAGLIRRLPEAEVTTFSVAFGTYSMMSVLDTLTSRPRDAEVPDPRQLLYPDDTAWRTAVWRSAIVVLQRTLTAIHAD
ncbi:MAG: DUF2817 domain-containing protein [Rhodospirillales bacterium]|nr:MAG: DUF2817 domain-containing protein [Rhodospirillales bacterium]